MKFKVDAFPTLIMQFTDVLSSNELNDIFDILKTKDTSEDGTLINGTSNFNVSLKESILEELSILDIIQEKVDEYCREIKFKKLNITNSWFSIQDIGGLLLDHVHCGSIISGVFYINAGELSSPLVFENPNPLSSFNFSDPSILTGHSNYTNQVMRFTPNTGDLLLFPSWLKHGSEYCQKVLDSIGRWNVTIHNVISESTKYPN